MAHAQAHAQAHAFYGTIVSATECRTLTPLPSARTPGFPESNGDMPRNREKSKG